MRARRAIGRRSRPTIAVRLSSDPSLMPPCRVRSANLKVKILAKQRILFLSDLSAFCNSAVQLDGENMEHIQHFPSQQEDGKQDHHHGHQLAKAEATTATAPCGGQPGSKCSASRSRTPLPRECRKHPAASRDKARLRRLQQRGSRSPRDGIHGQRRPGGPAKT